MLQTSNAQPTLVGHSSVDSCPSVSSGGKIHRRAQANLCNLLRTRGPPRAKNFVLIAHVEKAFARKSATPNPADSCPAVGFARRRSFLRGQQL